MDEAGNYLVNNNRNNNNNNVNDGFVEKNGFYYHPPVYGKQKVRLNQDDILNLYNYRSDWRNESGDMEEEYYMAQMEMILGPWEGAATPLVPTKLLPHLYMGCRKDLKDLNHLKRLGITHILNCAGTQPFSSYDLANNSEMKMYAQFHALDSLDYDIFQHFSNARVYIDRARMSGGKVFVHCQMGINRSAAICAAYIMNDEELDLLSTVEMMQKKRGLTLVNYGFRRRLIHFARERGLLKKRVLDMKYKPNPTYSYAYA